MEKLERACSTAFQSLMQSDLKYKDKQAHQERCKVVYEGTHFSRGHSYFKQNQTNLNFTFMRTIRQHLINCQTFKHETLSFHGL